MMKVCLLFLGGISIAYSAGPRIVSFGVGEVSHSTAHFWWITDIATTKNVIKYGPTSAYGSISAPIPDNSRNHAWWVSDQVAGSTLHYVLCSTAGGTESCTPDQVITFDADRKHPVVPELPRTVPPADPGPVTGTIFDVAVDCSDLQAQIDAALASDGNLTHWVRIAADGSRGAECYVPGQIVVGAKVGENSDGPGYVIIGPDPGGLPPDGVRVDRTYQKAGKLATVIGGLWMAYSFKPTCGRGLNYAGVGSLKWDLSDPEWAMTICDPQSVAWTAVPAVAHGTAVPGECIEGSWFDKTDAPSHEDRPWHCTTIDGITKYRPRRPQGFDAIGDDAVFRFQAGAHHVVLRGLRVAHPPVPTSYAAALAADGAGSYANQVGSFYSSVISIARNNFGSVHDLIFDRNIVEGWGYPTRSWNAFGYMDGQNLSIVNNLVDGFTSWQGSANATVASYGGGISILDGPGPYRIENNDLTVVGTAALFIGDDNSGISMPAPHDFTIRRNTFRKPDWANGCDASTDGHYYWQRHNLECKSCLRVLIEGNWFDGGWRGLNTGASIALSVRPGALHNVSINNGSVNTGLYPFGGQVGDRVVIFGASEDSHNGTWTVSDVSTDRRTLTVDGLAGVSTGGQMFVTPYTQTVSDITARYNLFTNTQQAFSNNANNDNYQTTAAASGKRWWIEHNVALGIGQKAGWGLGVPCDKVNSSPYWTSIFIIDELGGEDHVIQHNTSAFGKRGITDYLGTVCGYTDFAGSTEKIEGFYCNNNIQTVTDGMTANGFWYSGAAEGDKALTLTTSRGTLLNNIFMRPNGTLPNYNTSNRAIVDNAAIGWTGRDQVLQSSSPSTLGMLKVAGSSVAARMGTDGGDAGADIAAIVATTGVVGQISVVPTDTKATLNFKAPDTAGCAVDVSADPDFSSWQRFANDGGDTDQKVEVTGLNPQSRYYYRINCSVQQPRGVIDTTANPSSIQKHKPGQK